MNLAERTIAVTGATGFLGRYISTALLKRRARVVGAVRSLERGADLSDQGVVLRTADLLDAAALRSAFQGVDAVVANAALILADQKSDFVRINVDGMGNLLRAAVEANVRRLLVVSTVSIYRHNGKNNDENATQVPYTEEMLQRQPYGATKAQAEVLAWNAADKAGLEVTTVRPGYIYGRGAHVIETFRAWLGGPVALIPCYRRIPLAYAGDVAEAIVR
ncbi:MAG: NAD-dependent epimerase/dehydratase family protein, partial [Pseudomonadales bacterium]